MFANTWIYVGHDSQVPNAGDYYGTTIGNQPMLMVRHTDGRSTSCIIAARTRAPASPSNLRQHRKVLPLPLPCLDFQDRRLAARDPPEQGLRAYRRERARPIRAFPGPAYEKLPRLRVRQDERCRPRLRRIFRRKPFDHRQHGRSLSSRPAGSRRRRAPLHAQLQLENAGREPDRHLPSDGRP